MCVCGGLKPVLQDPVYLNKVKVSNFKEHVQSEPKTHVENQSGQNKMTNSIFNQ